MYALCEKIKVMMVSIILVCCDENGLPNHQEISKKYIDLVEANVRAPIDKLRFPVVHGIGGADNMATRVITDYYEGWELSIVGEPDMINSILEASYQWAGHLPPVGDARSPTGENRPPGCGVGIVFRPTRKETRSVFSRLAVS